MIGPEVDRLVQMLARLPGLGPRSARRAALHLLKRRDRTMLPLAEALCAAAQSVRTCRQCGNLGTIDPCAVCADSQRDRRTLCVVEEVGDLWALERTGVYRGLYHVLGGALSAINGRGPEQLSITALIRRASSEIVGEVILATNATMDGQITAHYLAERLEDANVAVSRLAHGVPLGGELDYLDDGTLIAALKARS